MTEQFVMQGVVLSILSGIAFVVLAFVLYWKLLGERYVQRKQVERYVQRKQVPAPARVSTKVQFEQRRTGREYAGAES